MDRVCEQMEFDEDYNDFLDGYSFMDREEIYTNGSMLIPTFRAKQGMEHYVNQARKDGFYKCLEEIYEKMDEGVCEICEYNDMDNGKNQCYKNCTHEFETLKKWLEEKIKESNNGRI